MKYFTIFIFIPLGVMLLGTGCNTTDKGTIDDAIKPGLYELRAHRSEIDGETISSSPVGGYFEKTYQIFEEDSIRIQVASDIPDENGYATGSYTLSEEALIISIQNSTTSYFKSDSSITFTNFEIVDSSYIQTFPTDTEEYVFKGPGLLLKKRETDHEDIDNDSDTSEVVYKTEFFEYAVRYD